MANRQLILDPDRLFVANERERSIARELYDSIKGLPILSPHGHTDPEWFAQNRPFVDAASLIVTPDHYLLRMLYSDGVPLEELGVSPVGGDAIRVEPREIWRRFAERYHLFRATPSQLWLNHVFYEIFGIREILDAQSADTYFDQIGAALATEEFRPLALLDRFGIELIATTEGALDPLVHHRKIAQSEYAGRVVTTFRPDDVTDASRADFADNIRKLGELTGEDTQDWSGYLSALRQRRRDFAALGATATDHGPASAQTADLPFAECAELFSACINGSATIEQAALFSAQMLTEMAAMSLEDGLAMQLHPGAWRNHNAKLASAFGPDKGGDIPTRTDYVSALKPLLDRFGNETALTLILFTLDESAYSRELAPLAGHYPCLKLGPAWWFHDSPEGMLRYRQLTTETAGFYNTVGFNDDTRAFFSIPARHDVARRIDCRFLAMLVAQGRLALDEAHEIASELAYGLAKRAYRIGEGRAR